MVRYVKLVQSSLAILCGALVMAASSMTFAQQGASQPRDCARPSNAAAVS